MQQLVLNPTEVVKPVTLAACIGRFSIVHNEHERMFRQMANERSHVLIMLGSANRIISPKNAFSFEERKKFITDIFAQFMDINNLKIVPLNDTIYMEGQWEVSVQTAVDRYAEELDITDKQIAMYGNEKDRTGYWQRNFPQWKQVDVGLVRMVDASRLRRIWLDAGQTIPPDASALQMLPQPMKDYLNNLHQFNPDLQSDYLEYLKEEETFKTYPYRGLRDKQEDHLNVACADVIVECSGHVLTVTRAHSPGKGNKAWPGGHKKAWETYLECAFRELYEETNLRIPERTLRRCIVATNLFDHTARNVGSVSRHSFGVYVKLDPRDDGSLPLARGGDDAHNPHLPHGGCGWVKKDLILSGKQKMHDDHSDMLAFFHR